MDPNEEPKTTLHNFILWISATALITGLFYYLHGPTFAVLVAYPIYYLFANNWFHILSKTWKRDIHALQRFFLLNYHLKKLQNVGTVAKVFNTIADKHPDKIAVKFEDRHMTFGEMSLYTNKVANHFKSLGFQRGDTIALFMETRPEYVCLWLGLSKIGVVSALINTNQRTDPLVHSIACANSKAIICSEDLRTAVNDVESQLGGIQIFEFVNDWKTDAPLNNAINNASSELPLADLNMGEGKDKLVYIYTSGTTGLPKAAVINSLRFMFMVCGIHYMLDMQKDDIIYDPLPLYHSAGGMVGIGQTLLFGTTVALRKKFSASNFWKDCIKFECTGAQYIGEICRYLLNVPEKAEDKQHKLRVMFGNGLRPQIWSEFVKRFNIAEIGEFYGATEGNSNIINIDSKLGAVGFVPRYAGMFHPVTLVRCDQVTGEIIRNSRTGLCMRCKVGEPGIFVGKINPNKAINAFSGYADKNASEKKVIQNVFKDGDCYFNSGDILVMDQYGYYYFKDRTGDTFRWRGENVATSEVETVISTIIGLQDAVVYGVEIPGVEGKAGMAAIVDTNQTLDLNLLAQGVYEKLASYARPIFIRVLNEVPLTGTYKLKKRDLQLDGYNVHQISDKLYILQNNKYVELTPSLYDDLINGKLKY